MKKTICLIFSAFFIFIQTVPVFAANQVSAIDIDAVIYEDGSMYVTQVFDVSFDEGTEFYIPMNAPDYLTISDLQVTDTDGGYQMLESWDVNAGFEEKAYKCGVNDTDTGYEICFGISRYGEKRYAIEYRLQNAVGSYNDLDGVNFRFVNEGMNTTPTDVNIAIRLFDGTAITDENCDIWGFGFEGEAAFEDGIIRAYTQTPITADNHVTVMFGFQKGVLKPVRVENDSFETVKQKAFEGSDYDYEGDETSTLFAILMMVLSLAVPVVMIVAAVKLKRKLKREKLNRFVNQSDYFRDIPNSGNINASYALLRLFELCDDGVILGTGMLHLINLGCLVPVSTEKTGFMGKTREIVNLQMAGSNHGEMNEYDEYLYTVLEGATGSDGILQAKELERFAGQHDTLLRSYISKCETEGRKYLRVNHCLKQWDMPSKTKYLTESGKKELLELMGFKRYLADFSLIAERGVKEIPIWKELLTYAMLFGIADSVSSQMKEMYPDIAAQTDLYGQSVMTAYSYYHLMSVNMRQAEAAREQSKRSSGSGGMSSLGGGGGSVGGGSGGGTR